MLMAAENSQELQPHGNQGGEWIQLVWELEKQTKKVSSDGCAPFKLLCSEISCFPIQKQTNSPACIKMFTGSLYLDSFHAKAAVCLALVVSLSLLTYQLPKRQSTVVFFSLPKEKHTTFFLFCIPQRLKPNRLCWVCVKLIKKSC